MWFFWIVGREMESLYGSRDFLAFYLCAAIFSTLAWVLIDAASNADPTHPMIGASGAVMATMMLFTLFYPKREILFFFIPMPMWVLVAIYLFLPADPCFGRTIRRTIAVESHLAGAGFAFLFKQFDLRWSRLFSGRVFKPQAPHLLAGSSRANADAIAESVANVGERGQRGQVGAGLRHPRGAARRQARRSARQDRPRRPLRPDRRRASGPARGEPSRTHPPERPHLSDAISTPLIRDAALADRPAIVEFNRCLALETEGKVLDEAVLLSGVSQSVG